MPRKRRFQLPKFGFPPEWKSIAQGTIMDTLYQELMQIADKRELHYERLQGIIKWVS